MPFSLENEICAVKSLFPGEGGAEISVYKENKFYIRVPHWVNKSKVVITVNGKPAEPVWNNSEAVSGYIIAEAKSSDNIKVTWPLVKFTSISQVWPDTAPDLKVEFDWLGNMVTGCRPEAAKGSISLFHKNPRIIL